MASNDKYDRQLRLWGASGQAALARTCVVLVRATAAGTETCKNLVLPGVGAILVLDDCQLLNLGTTATTASSVSSDSAPKDDTLQIPDDPPPYASNFFLTRGDLESSSTKSKSMSRADIALKNLMELNSDVQGSSIHSDSLWDFDFVSLLKSSPSSRFPVQKNTASDAALSSGAPTNQTTAMNNGSLTQWLVVASDLEADLLPLVATACHETHTPLLAVHAYGLSGILRLQAPLTPVMNPKPRDAVPDLRLMHPFPALQALADSIHLSELENHVHAQVPFPILLLKVAAQYRLDHTNLPQTWAEKQDFAQRIKNASRNFDTELNFQEAVRYAYTAYTSSRHTVDFDHLSKLKDTTAGAATRSPEQKGNVTAASLPCQQLHILLCALHTFLQQRNHWHISEGKAQDDHVSSSTLAAAQPPLQGSIPDMTASTDLYVQLQTVYRKQAETDRAVFKQLLLHEQQKYPNVRIDDETIAIFCQNVHLLNVLDTGASMTAALQNDKSNHYPDDVCSELSTVLQDFLDDLPVDEEAVTEDGPAEPPQQQRCDQLPLLWYLGFEACQRFYIENERYPGTPPSDFQDYNYTDDAKPLHSCLVSAMQKYKVDDHPLWRKSSLSLWMDVATEYCRYGNSEIHTMASLIGGVASQEAVKLITGQYVPMNNTYVYNGIASVGAVYKL